MNKEEINETLQKYYCNWEIRKQLVTVFLLTHQRPFLLKKMVYSILNQSYDNFYLIIIDNNSKDQTKDVVCSFDDERVIYLEIKSDDNEGVSNFKFAFNICKTKYLTVFHDDDILHKDYLKKMIPFMESGSYSLGASYFDIINENDEIIYKSNCSGQTIKYSNSQYLINSFTLWLSKGILFPASIYKVDFYSNIDDFMVIDAGPSRDNYLCMQVERYGGVIGLLDEALYLYRRSNLQNCLNPKTVTIMHIVLIKHILHQDYYRNIVRPYLFRYRQIVVECCKRSIKFYREKKLNLTFIRYVYKLIPNNIKTGEAFYYSLSLFLVCYLPFLRFIFYKLYRLNKYNI